jgi:leucyl aminopeptidase
VINITTGAPDGADLLVVPVMSDRVPACSDDLTPDLDELEVLLDAKGFTGKKGQTLFVVTPQGPTPEMLLVGLGDDVDTEGLRRAAGTVTRTCRRYETVATTLHHVDLEDAASAVALGSWLGAYAFNEYKSEPKESVLSNVVLVDDEDLADPIASSAAIARGVVLARDLINRPAWDKAPAVLAQVCEDLSDKIDVTVYDEDQIADAGFGGLQAVNLGADNPARMVVMRYRPEGATKTVAFVGKGIVFDSGGLSIKPAAGMETMKTDMAGAAAVMGAMQAIADLGLVVNVTGITPFTENMTGGSALRPGDVMRAYNGKTMEVLNTDAEGRLVLADGLALATEDDPDLIVDIATLTGACKVALGPLVGGLVAKDDEAADLVLNASEAAGEAMWRLPFVEEYRSMVESDIADMKNIGGRWGGAITAAIILSEFVGDIPWVHLDIAGPGRADKTEHYVFKGGSGFGVRTLVATAETLSDD